MTNHVSDSFCGPAQELFIWIFLAQGLGLEDPLTRRVTSMAGSYVGWDVSVLLRWPPSLQEFPDHMVSLARQPGLLGGWQQH